jgi:phosphoglycerate dehydrogenase-like enzyme
VLPEPRELFVEAVTAAGGTVEVLSDRTRGVVWLAEQDPVGLEAVLRAHPGVGWVQLPWAGVDAYLDVLHAHAGRAFPLWTSAKGAYSEPVAEHAVMLALALLRGIPEKARSTSWAAERTGRSIYGRRVLIVGAGGIATEIVRLLAPFETPITIVRRSAEPMPGVDRTVTSDRLADELPNADVVILAAAATGRTENLIGAAEIAAMKPDAVLVNIARGALVDSLALAAALHAGHLAGAGLDVTAPEPLPDGHPLWGAPRCVITSHSADTPEMVLPLLAGRVRANVAALLGDGAFVGVVDPGEGY